MRGGTVSEVFVSFQGEGTHAGRRHLFVRFAGCPLRCRYCDTPESFVPSSACRILGPDGTRIRSNPLGAGTLAAEVAALVGLAPPLHALAVTGGEPLVQADFLVEWLETCPPGLPVLLETAGVMPERLGRVLPWVAILSLDFKCPSNTGEGARWAEHEACLEAGMRAGCEVYVKMPVDETTSAEEVARGAALVARLGPAVPLFLTPITEPGGAGLLIGAASVARLHAAASAAHGDVRVLPQLHKVLGML